MTLIDGKEEVFTVTTEKLLEIKKWFEDQAIPNWGGVVIFTKNMWLKIREKKLCENFTDEELERAMNGNGIIKIGWVAGCYGNVHMAIDRYYEKCTSNLK